MTGPGDGPLAIRTGTPRAGPRYVAIVEATAKGPVVRPVYVARVELVPDPRTGSDQISLTAPRQAIPKGAAVFTLDAALMGIVRDDGDTMTVLTGEYLKSAAEGAQQVAAGPRGWIGIEVQPLTPAVARATGSNAGVVVTHVEPGGPAAKALKSGDVIQAIGGTPVTSVGGLRQVERALSPGADVALVGSRRGAPLQLSVTAMDAASGRAPTGADSTGFVGRSVRGSGTEVVAVNVRSPAADAGLRAGDLIVAVDGSEAPTDGNITGRYRAARPGEALLLTVSRDGRYHVFALEKR